MVDIKQWFVEKKVAKTIKALESNFFEATYFTGRESLINGVLGHVKPKIKIGFSGSVSLREIGLIERLQKEDVLLLDHWKEGLTKEEISEIRIQQLTCDLFIASANAITEKGEIVNIDGFGNRINGITFGPKKVIIIAGYNKIVLDVDSALERVKNVAAPMNAKRLNLPLPCAETGYCHDCKSETRICRVISTIQRRPGATDISVFLINEALGY